jgi:hypothetical protein
MKVQMKSAAAAAAAAESFTRSSWLIRPNVAGMHCRSSCEFDHICILRSHHQSRNPHVHCSCARMYQHAPQQPDTELICSILL